MKPVDFLVAGAGPAGLAAAIRFKQKRPDAVVMVIDKAARLGSHSLSGAVIETACLDALLPGWRDGAGSLIAEMPQVVRDEMYFLTAGHALRIPGVLVPAGMHHRGDHVVALGRLSAWLGRVAVGLGVEVYTGFAAKALIWKQGVVKGIRLVDQGYGQDGKARPGSLSGEEIYAAATLVTDGAGGALAREYAMHVGGRINPQVYSVGVKQVFRLPAADAFGAGRVIHTLGYPNRPDVFGGGFVYGMAGGLLAVGLILGLDWRYTDLNPQQELEVFKAHPFIARMLRGAQVLEAGAKIIPEGGFYALPRLWCDGALIAGDAAGFVNMQKIKGVHYAILSGMAAADAAAGGDLSAYPARLAERGVLSAMRQARNFRACFQPGLYAGAPLSQIQQFIPWRMGMGEDHQAARPGARLARQARPAIDRSMFAALSGTMHREDVACHIAIIDHALCVRCGSTYQSPCTAFCPAAVYRRDDAQAPVHVSASNCVHCGVCSVKCPLSNIRWTPPEGGEGPKYKMM